MHVYSEKDPVEIKVKDSVLSVACVFSKRKLMHAVKDLILEDCAVLERFSTLLKVNHPQGTTQGNRSLEGREEGWREAKISCEHL